MGQYHQTFAMPARPELEPDGKAEFFDHYTMSGGAKLCEQYYTWKYEDSTALLASPCAAAIAVLTTLGPWKGKRIVTIGDYEEGPLSIYYGNPAHLTDNVTAMATSVVAEAFGWTFEIDSTDSPWLDLSLPDNWLQRINEANAMFIPDWTMVLTNQDAGHGGEYLSPGAFASPPSPVASCIIGGVWPVALIMTAISDGGGGGDARFEIPGRWESARFAWLPKHEAQQAGMEDITEWALEQSEVSNHILASQ